MSSSPLLEIEDLSTFFHTEENIVKAVRNVNLTIHKGETLALVGESGAGKSAGAMAVIGLLPEYAEVSGSVRLHGDELLGLPDKQMSRIRGNRIGTVFQDPMSALTPVYPVGDQIAEAIFIHQRELSDRAARARAVELLELVGIAQPEQRVGERRCLRLFRGCEIARSIAHDRLAGEEFDGCRIGRQFGLYQHGRYVAICRRKIKRCGNFAGTRRLLEMTQQER